MTWDQILAALITSAGAGAFNFAVIAVLDKFYAPVRSEGLPAVVKYYLALGLAFVTPLAAYYLEVHYGLADFGPAGLAGAIIAGYAISQGIHWTAQKAGGAA